MFKVVVYDDAKPSFPLEIFTGENELAVVKKGLNAVDYYRSSGKAALGRYTMKLTKGD